MNCPTCGKEAKKIPAKTLKKANKNENWYHCFNPSCPMMVFEDKTK